MNSYLILDENLCFLNCTKGGKEPSPSIRDVPISVALQSAGFDSESWRELYPKSLDFTGGLRHFLWFYSLFVRFYSRFQASDTSDSDGMHYPRLINAMAVCLRRCF